MYICTSLHSYILVCVYIYVRTYIYPCIPTYVYLHISICIYIYIYNHPGTGRICGIVLIYWVLAKIIFYLPHDGYVCIYIFVRDICIHMTYLELSVYTYICMNAYSIQIKRYTCKVNNQAE